MKDTTKTIIIGVSLTILVLILTIFILYKSDNKKLDDKNTTTNNNQNNTDNNSSNNSSSSNNNTSITIKDDEKDEKVILYLFHGNTCPACQNAISNIKNERNTTFKNVEIRTFEIYKNKDNSQLYNILADKFKLERKRIPYFIIGEFNQVGFNFENLLKEYKNALKNKNYKDIVNEIIKENPNINPTYETI